MLQQTIHNIESIQVDVEVFQALKQGDQVISDLQKQASLEDFEALYDKHQDQKSRMEFEQDLFGKVLDQDELQAELDQLEADDALQDLPDPSQDILANQKSHQEAERGSQKQEQQQKRQLVAA